MADQFKPNIYSQGLWNLFYPGIANFASQFGSMAGAPGYGMPQAPTMPSMSGVLTGAGLPNYAIPSTNSMMPTKDWWSSLAPGVKEGAWMPFKEGQQNLLETLGGSGMAESARGGYSGAAGAALGEYMADAVPAYSMNLWNMTAPGAMAGWQANLERNKLLGQAGYQNRLAERSQDYQNTMNQLQQNYQGAMTGWQMPWQMAMNYNNLAPSGAYHSEGGGTLGSILGATTSIAAPLAMGYGMGGFGGAGKGAGGGANSLMFNPYMGGNIGNLSPFGMSGR